MTDDDGLSGKVRLWIALQRTVTWRWFGTTPNYGGIYSSPIVLLFLPTIAVLLMMLAGSDTKAGPATKLNPAAEEGAT